MWKLGKSSVCPWWLYGWPWRELLPRCFIALGYWGGMWTQAYWVLSASFKTDPYDRVKDIDFSKIPCSTSTVKPSSASAPSETELTSSMQSRTALPMQTILLYWKSQKKHLSHQKAAGTGGRKDRGQASSWLWFRMRTGRITASKFKKARHTDPAWPSHSLIMSISHPEMTRFKTEATKWGCHHD